LCDRHRGVGADGLLFLRRDDEHGVVMEVSNADGSEAKMCGNGLRCVAHFLDQVGDPAEHIGVCGRSYTCERVGPQCYRVGMGAASDSRPLAIDFEDKTIHGTFVNMGNPHWVHITEAAPMSAAHRMGPTLESHAVFEDRANVSFVRYGETDRVWDTVVYERGVGITQSCGSGACAVGVALCGSEKWPTGEALVVRLPGGDLRITVADDGDVSMEGHAAEVFVADVDVDSIYGAQRGTA
jgi:diaminopimelate epimerase